MVIGLIDLVMGAAGAADELGIYKGLLGMI
jgi:hypothetical protein